MGAGFGFFGVCMGPTGIDKALDSGEIYKGSTGLYRGCKGSMGPLG